MKVLFYKKDKSLKTRDRSIIKDVLAILLITTGIITILYPSIRNFYYDTKQNAIMEDYLETIRIIQVIDDDMDNKVESSQDRNELENEKILEMSKKWPVESTLIIEKINLLMPVIKGATKEHLNVSIASVDNTGKPWDSNNYVIAGHRSRTFGRHFNRLDELEINDEILVVDTQNNEFNYRIFSKEIVKETEISVLENRNKSELTLITCHPINVKNPPTRLVIKAIQIN